ncbi:MAG: glycosyltransferase family protein [Candidatus Omnitrophica bacterium]|nr:glycosyltransferase family protein [Candidatus Omnitrophota bacterium]
MDPKGKTDHILAVVQARMGSKRLPGKVLSDILGRPMIFRIVERLKMCKSLSNIVVATSTDKRDDAVEESCKRHGLTFYRGQEQDLTDRFYQAAKLFNADAVLRVTADCPVVDPRVTDGLIDFFLANKDKYDYVSNARPRPTYPHGMDVEIFSFSLLERLWNDVKDPFRREWFTTLIFENPKDYRIACFENDRDLSDIRLTVDYEEDLELVRYVYDKLYSKDRCFLLEDIIKLREQDPEIFEINKKYGRNLQYFEELKKRGLPNPKEK